MKTNDRGQLLSSSAPFWRLLRNGVAVLPLALTLAPLPSAAQETAAAADEESEEAEDEIVVTGTSIRGVAPVGGNVVTVDAEAIEASGASSASEVLGLIPQVGGAFFNGVATASPGQIGASFGNNDDTARPTLRGAQAGSSGNTTLLLIDGNRASGVGTNRNAGNPDSVPPALLERVEVSLDGGSAIYGSDAIAGVINFVTRRRFEGLDVSLRGGSAEDYSSWDGNVVFGDTWGPAAAFVSVSYAENDPLFFGDRDWYRQVNDTTGAEIGLDCGTPNATGGNASAGNPRFYPALGGGLGPAFTLGSPIGSAPTGTPNTCSLGKGSTAVNAHERLGILTSFAFDFSDDIEFTVRARYSEDNATATQPPELFAGATIRNNNPYWRALPVPDNTLTQYNVRGHWGALTGPNERTTEQRQWGATADLKWDVNENWQLRLTGVYDESESGFRVPQINPTAAGYQGTTTTPCHLASVAWTTTPNATTLAAAQAACFNPFDLGASNPALLTAALDRIYVGGSKDRIYQFRAVADGALFTLPGGDVKVAAGYEYFTDETANGQFVGSRSGAAPVFAPPAELTANSFFGEIIVPVVGPDNNVPLVHSLRLSASARTDDYNTVGSTTNPRYGMTYEPFEWWTFRASYGESFRAPTTLNIIGSRLSGTSIGQNTVAGTFGLDFSGALQRSDPANPPDADDTIWLFLQGTQPGLTPELGENWSYGTEIRPIDGLTLSLTYYENVLTDSFFSPSFASFFNRPTASDPPGTSYVIPGISELATIHAPGGAFTAADIAAFISQAGVNTTTTALANPSTVYGVYDLRFTNLSQQNLEGLDYSARYEFGTGFGSMYFSLGGTYEINNTIVTFPGAAPTDRRDQSVSRMVGEVGFDAGPWRGQATAFHTQGYKIPLATATLNQDNIDAYTTLNTYLSYTLPDAMTLGERTEVSLTIQNLLDQDLPNAYSTNTSTSGGVPTSGGVSGRDIGRFIQLGVRARF